MKKTKTILIIGNILFFLSLYISNDYYLPNYDLIKDSDLFLWLVINTWLPLPILIGITIIYSFTTISAKFKIDLRYVYAHLIILIIGLVLLFGLKEINKLTGKLSIDIMILLLFLLSSIFQLIFLYRLEKEGFDIGHEFQKGSKIVDEYNRDFEYIKILKKKMDKAHIVYFIVYVISPPVYVYVLILLMGTIYVSPYLMEMKDRYLDISYMSRKKPIYMVIIYYLCCLASIPAYLINSLFAMLVMWGGEFMKSLLDNEYSQRKYAEIEEDLDKDKGLKNKEED